MKTAIIEAIQKYDTIIIHRHIRPDEDAYGSQMGLGALIELNYPHKKVYRTGQHDTSLSYLGQPDIVADEVYNGALVIVTDTANQERIDDQRYLNGAMLIKIDHHPNDDAYGDLTWVNTDASSCSEMIFNLFEEAELQLSWRMNQDAARFLFAGIVGDTGRFIYPSATEETFSTVSRLVQYKFDRTALFDGMYELSAGLVQLQGYIYQNFVMDEHGAAYIKLPLDILNKFGVTASETSALVSSLGHVKGILAWAIFVEEKNQIRIRLRSKGMVINTLAKKYRGGGHPYASGATIYDWAEADELIAELKAICSNY
ncbi:DHH family phosphoesterase [Kurthia sibirica]|uniref:DHH family phosphoesterase n=1 Tax=Kurthia sibirica TaxID=202750 RepID=A0A2U3ANU3_9BACL|nr:bifunctional oligoribonuclease/PAP phosphatase NrnA [Kurthia sibirica]PWI26201.1 DHH family phosphoesterase [Kurthia sibirica]GEK34714.1 bifunctional oligoribonuclease and PAP phosphatase NrnA [Kurthia sibirica]